eukprot:10133897-Alexandrium_andersonii.AAC.1
MAEHPDEELEDYATFVTFREAVTEHARAVGPRPMEYVAPPSEQHRSALPRRCPSARAES